LSLHCPICKKAVTAGSEDFPFCSERCRLIDLGKWASGAYVIPAPLQDTEEDVAEVPSDGSEEDS
jgi:uncharacterized protein